MLDRPFLSRFSPQRSNPDDLEKILVQRHDLLAESVERIRDSVLTDNKHHLLFIGPRGIGKTNLVSLIVHRLKKLPKLQSKMRLAWLNEDETATSFLKLLILIYRDLTQRYPDEFPTADLQRVYGHKPDHARELLGASLLEHLGKRTLVVIMENLDSLFKDMPVEEQRTWRAFVQNHPVFATVGTAQSLFDGVSERTEPFFGFFDTRHLDNLTVDEAITLLRNVAKLNRDDKLEAYLATPTGHARVQAIHDLAGGNPRIYMIFSSFLTVELLDDLVRPFEETADQQLTSYYQERLRWLSAQQREIVQYLCHQRFPVPVKQIAEGMFASHQTIANQLKILRDYRYVRGNERGREVLYELSEPLMRLALQVKETHDRKPLSLIVDFLRVWYDRDELEARLKVFDTDSPARAYFEAALELLRSQEPNLRHQLLRSTISQVVPSEFTDAQLQHLQVLADESNLAEDWIRLSDVHEARSELDRAMASLDRAIKCPNSTPTTLANALFTRGYLFDRLGNPLAAIADFSVVLATQGVTPDFGDHALAMRGLARKHLGDYENALKDLNCCINKVDVTPGARIAAISWRGDVYLTQNKVDQALADFETVATQLNEFPAWAFSAFLNRALAKMKAADWVGALKDLFSCLAIGDNFAAEFFKHRTQEFSYWILHAIFNSTSEPKEWLTHLQRLVGHLHQTEINSETASALLSVLPDVAGSQLNDATKSAWVEACSVSVMSLPPESQKSFEVPLRLLRTGIAYYKTKDEGVLLSLPSEERKILRQVLKLEPEPAA